MKDVVGDDGVLLRLGQDLVQLRLDLLLVGRNRLAVSVKNVWRNLVTFEKTSLAECRPGSLSRAVFPSLFWFAAPLLSYVDIGRHP